MWLISTPAQLNFEKVPLTLESEEPDYSEIPGSPVVLSMPRPQSRKLNGVNGLATTSPPAPHASHSSHVERSWKNTDRHCLSNNNTFAEGGTSLQRSHPSSPLREEGGEGVSTTTLANFEAQTPTTWHLPSKLMDFYIYIFGSVVLHSLLSSCH